MKGLRALAASAALALGVAAGLPAAAQVASMGPGTATIRAAGSYPADHLSTKAMERFASTVATTTGGQLKIEVAPEAGSVDQLVDGLQKGDPAIIWVDLAQFARFAPELQALTLPFLMPSREQAFKVVEGPVVDLINVWLRARNFLVLGYMDAGLSPLFTVDKPVRTIEDLKGLQLAVRDEAHAAAWRAVGAEPKVMPAADAFAALKQGQIQGLEAPYGALLANLPQQSQGYVSGINPIIHYVVVVANRQRWNRLAIEHQRVAEQAMRNAVIWERGATAAAEDAAWTKLEDRGLMRQEVSAELDQRLWGASAGLVEEARKAAGREFVNAIIAEAR